MRVVIDTNILVSLIAFSSRALAWLPVAWRRRDIIPLANPETTAELVAVLNRREFNLPVTVLTERLSDYLLWCESVAMTEPPPVPECRDPDDRIFLELAQFAQADALVTGDADLLALAPVFAIPIITPNELRLRLVASTG